MRRILAGALLLVAAAALPLTSCVVYPVPVDSQPSLQERFDRSWSAAFNAMVDEGVTVTQQDRGAGVVRGSRGGDSVVASVQTLPDGRIQVRFDGNDPALVHRVSDGYDRRMGR